MLLRPLMFAKTPFNDGDFIETSWLDLADSLFYKFYSKDKIVQRLEDLSIS